MPEVDDWRRRRAEELYNGAAIPRSPLEARAAMAAAVGGDAATIVRPAAAHAATPLAEARAAPTLRAVPPVPTIPPAVAGRPRMERRRSSRAATGVAVAAALLAGATGWMARGLTSPDAPTTVRAAPAAALRMAPVAVIAPPAELPEASPPEVAPPPIAPPRAIVARPGPVSALARHRVRRTAPAESVPPEVRLAARTSPSLAARPARGDAPSFSCRRGHGTVTAMICNDPDLARMDRALATRFAALDRTAAKDDVLRLHEGETAFLNARQSCRTPDCVADVYARRLDEIGASR